MPRRRCAGSRDRFDGGRERRVRLARTARIEALHIRALQRRIDDGWSGAPRHQRHRARARAEARFGEIQARAAARGRSCRIEQSQSRAFRRVPLGGAPMSYAIQSTTQVTTGMLPMLMIVSAALTAPVSLALLRLYRRAVLKSMAAQAGSRQSAPEMQVGTNADATPLQISV